MGEHRTALEKIMRLCAESRTYSRRTQLINSEAMKALGMTAGQRHQVHIEIMDRLGDKPIKEAYLRRKAKRDAAVAAYALETHGVVLPPMVESVADLQAAAEHEDAHGAFHLDGVHG